MSESHLVTSLKHQLAKYQDAITEFHAIEAQLRLQKQDARVADMLRVNREAINAMERSAQLVRGRLSAAVATGTPPPFEKAG